MHKNKEYKLATINVSYHTDALSSQLSSNELHSKRCCITAKKSTGHLQRDI